MEEGKFERTSAEIDKCDDLWLELPTDTIERPTM